MQRLIKKNYTQRFIKHYTWLRKTKCNTTCNTWLRDMHQDYVFGLVLGYVFGLVLDYVYR